MKAGAIVIQASAQNGAVSINPDGTLHYVPKADFFGTDTVTYTISDGKGGTADLARLFDALSAIDGLDRLRYATSHPRDMEASLIAAHEWFGMAGPFEHVIGESEGALARDLRSRDLV